MNTLNAVLIVLLATVSMQVKGQDCSTSNIWLNTQNKVDNFQANYGGGGVCDNVTGNLTVIIGTEINNIDGLLDLVHVEGEVLIQKGTTLTDLDGLANLTSVGGRLVIWRTSLVSIDGLPSLTSVGGDLTISENADLIEIHGLTNLTSIGEDFTLWKTGVINFDGLPNLVNLGGGLRIFENIALTTVSGLANVINAGDNIFIYDNALLTDIHGLVNLQSVDGGLWIYSNDLLGDCTPIAALIGWPDGPPSDNVAGTITVESTNDPGCNSVQEILDSVSGPTAPTISSSDTQSDQTTLTFTPATTPDTIWPITGYQALCLEDESNVFQNNNQVNIPDESSVDSFLTVSQVSSINAASLNIPVNITHTRTRHLSLTLTSPNGTSVMLWDRAIGAGENLIGIFPTTLDPAESLNAFDGLNFNGEWRLTVADGVEFQTGTLNSWGITVRNKVTALSETSPITVTGLASNKVHSCVVSAITGLGTGPASNSTSVIFEIDTFAVGGSLSGIAGTGLVLQNNDGDDLTIESDGDFNFSTLLDDLSSYEVSVLKNPNNLSQTCEVTNGSGTLAGAEVTNVSVICTTDKFRIGGNVGGMAGTGLVLQNNLGDELAIESDGTFTFPELLDDGSSYSVTVLTQPFSPSQSCTVTGGNGTLVGADITSVAVTCVTHTFTVGGNVSGMAGSGLVLQNNLSDDLAIASDGMFTFPEPLDDGSTYSVTVLAHPFGPSQACTVINGSGLLASKDVTEVSVTCIIKPEGIFTDSFEE